MTYKESFQYVINKYSNSNIYVINLNKSIKCKCHHAGSNDPDPKCDKCLGTGYKIRISKQRGGPQTSTFPDTFRSTNQILITTNFYFLDNVEINVDDIIIYEDKAYIVNDTPQNRGFEGEFCYTKASGIPKKLNNKVFFRNLHRMLD